MPLFKLKNLNNISLFQQNKVSAMIVEIKVVIPGGTLVITFLACVVCLAVGGGLGYAFRGAENKALKAALALAKSDLANLKADALKKL